MSGLENLNGERLRLISEFHKLIDWHYAITENHIGEEVRTGNMSDPYYTVQWLVVEPRNSKKKLDVEVDLLTNSSLILNLLEAGVTPSDFREDGNVSDVNNANKGPYWRAKIFSKMLLYVMKDRYYTDSSKIIGSASYEQKAQSDLELAATFDFHLAMQVAEGISTGLIDDSEQVVVTHSLGHSGSHLFQIVSRLAMSGNFIPEKDSFYKCAIDLRLYEINISNERKDYGDEFSARHGLLFELRALYDSYTIDNKNVDAIFKATLLDQIKAQIEELISMDQTGIKRDAIIIRHEAGRYNRMLVKIKKMHSELFGPG